MSRDLTIGECMTKSPVTADRQMTLGEALRLMEDRGFRHLPVLHGKKLIGMVSQRELMALDNMRGFNGTGCTVEDFCLTAPYAVTTDALVRDVAKEMAEHKLGSAVVLSGDEVVGVFTTVDALRLLNRLLSEPAS